MNIPLEEQKQNQCNTRMQYETFFELFLQTYVGKIRKAHPNFIRLIGQPMLLDHHRYLRKDF